MPYVDFDEVKRSVTLEMAIGLLGLQMKKAGNQWRSPCPTCKTGGERALVVTEGKGFYCFGARAGGDVIALAAHIKGCSAKDAAQFLSAGNSTSNSTSSRNSTSGTVPQSAAGSDGTKKVKLLAVLEKLEPEHMAVDAIGFSTDFAKANGIGFCSRGTMAGYVLCPFRDEQGELLGFIGLTPEVKLPADFTPNVVDLEKRRA